MPENEKYLKGKIGWNDLDEIEVVNNSEKQKSYFKLKDGRINASIKVGSTLSFSTFYNQFQNSSSGKKTAETIFLIVIVAIFLFAFIFGSIYLYEAFVLSAETTGEEGVFVRDSLVPGNETLDTSEIPISGDADYFRNLARRN